MENPLNMITQSPPILNNISSPQARRKTSKTTIQSIISERLSLGEAAKMEMRSLATKTPVSILQELLSRRGTTPKYELVQIEGAIHEPVFRYRVCINNELVATGTGRSKKEAKHAAAKNLLELIIGNQASDQSNSTNEIATTEVSSTDLSNHVICTYDEKVMGNPIGWLQEMCMSRRWPPPSYEMIHEEGLPHERQFTIACDVLKHRELGTGKSKKLAKRMAAHKMWQTLQDVPLEGSNLPQVFEDEDELSAKVLNRYMGLKDSKIQTLTSTHSCKVSQFHKNLKQSIGVKLNELQTINLNSQGFNYVEFLQEIATEQQFEVTYVDVEEKTMSGKCQSLVQLSTLPVAVCYGTGITSKDAQSNASQNALEYLKIMTKK